MAVEIRRAASPAPKNLSLSRSTDHDGAAVKAQWGNPADALSDTDHKWSGVDENWTFNASRGMSGTVAEQRGNGHAMGDRVWVRDKGIHDNNTVWYDRTKYHPVTRDRYLTSVAAEIKAHNAKGSSTAKGSFSFAKPKPPDVGDPSYQDGSVTWTVETSEDDDRAEWYDTLYRVVRRSSASGAVKTLIGWTSTREASRVVSVSTDGDTVVPGEWFEYTVQAYARGIAGDSRTTESSYSKAYPAQASITSVVASSLSAGGVVTVRLRTNHHKKTSPVDTVSLQRLSNVTHSTASAAEAADGWEDVGESSGGPSCTGLSDTWEDAHPSVGAHTWYRLVTTHGGYMRYSHAVEAACLYRARTASSGAGVAIIYAVAGDDGESVSLRLGWGDDEYTRTEVSWSTRVDAWESNAEPSTKDVTWEDQPGAYPGYGHSATLTIYGLESGEPVWIQARRKSGDGEGTAFGPYSTAPEGSFPVTPAPIPRNVVLSAPEWVAEGSGADLSWTFEGGEQTAWQVGTIGSYGGFTCLASGEDSSGGCTLSAESLPEAGRYAEFIVSVTCGANWEDSHPVTISVAKRPTVHVATDEVLTAQPLLLHLSCSVLTASALVVVRSRGSSGSSPAGESVQAAGDVVWSSVTHVVWERGQGFAEGEGYGATVEVYKCLDLRDNASYDVRVVAIDDITGLSSDASAATFAVSWEHQAPAPSDESTVVPDVRALSCAVTPVAPETATEYDVCDVWRLTVDGSYLVASDVPFGRTVTDRYAPYSADGECRYRLCTRTADGDLDWIDVAYELVACHLRVDWGSSYVELPYDIEEQDTWEKPFELREHLDGARTGYWDDGATRKASISTKCVRADGETSRLLRSLARWDGPCFVRTPEGGAYEADVQVESMGTSATSAAVVVSLRVTEVDLTREYMIQMDEWGDET